MDAELKDKIRKAFSPATDISPYSKRLEVNISPKMVESVNLRRDALRREMTADMDAALNGPGF